MTGRTFESLNPANKTQVVGRFQKATEDLARHSVENAHETFLEWRNTPPEQRADLLFRVATLLRQRKHEMSAWMIYEVGKTWSEADGDTAEAIDFCEFYGREMLRYAQPPPLTRIEGEDNRLEYIPLGVGVVIPPWNFPLAIMAGMTVASVVTGNTVVLKPSSDAPTIAYKFLSFWRSGSPGVVTSRRGRAAMSAIHGDLRGHLHRFTGSKRWLRVNERARKPAGQLWIKSVVAEMAARTIIIARTRNMTCANESCNPPWVSGRSARRLARDHHQDVTTLCGEDQERQRRSRSVSDRPSTNMSAVINQKA